MFISCKLIYGCIHNNNLLKLLNISFPYIIYTFELSSNKLILTHYRKMLGDNIDIKVVKAVVICLLLTIATIVISFFRLITGSYIMGFFLFVFILWILVWKIGIMIMYPGSSAYFTSDI
jgi:hypothetical protein